MIYRIIEALISELISLAIDRGTGTTSEEFRSDLRKCITELENIKKYF